MRTTTWTYGGDPSANDRDEIRFLIGDTDTTDQLLTDEEIAYILTLYPDPSSGANYAAAAAAARRISASAAKQMTKSVGSLSLQYQERVTNFRQLAEDLEKEAKSTLLSSRIGAPQLFGGGKTYLGPDDSPETYEDTGRASSTDSTDGT